MPTDRRVLPLGRWGRLASWPWHVIVPVVVFVVVALAGITQSSIGNGQLREDPADPAGTMLGQSRDIRTDEYLTSTPIGIGVTASGRTEDLNPLTSHEELLSLLPAGPVSSVVFFEAGALRLGPWLPDEMLISAKWWLATLLLVLAAPAWFRALTGSRWIGWFAVVLLVFSPANAWWSNSSVGILGFSFAGAVALQRSALSASTRRWVHAVAWGLASAVLLARTPLIYPPWSIVMVPAVVLATVAWLLAQPGTRKAHVITVLSAGATTLALLGAIIWENHEAIEVVQGTIYPGSRVSSGAANALQLLFGATHLDILTQGAGVVASNQSEISSGFTVALVVAILLLARGFEARVVGHAWAVVTVLVVTGCWFAWASVDFGSLGSRLPLVNTVPSSRAAQTVGHLAVVLLCLVLPGAARRTSAAFALLVAAVTASVAGYAGSLLRAQSIPDLTVRSVWISAFALALVVFLLVYLPRRPWGYVLGGLLAFSLTWNVNPVLVGLGDLRDSDVAREMMGVGDRARAADEAWATDAPPVDSLLMATGVPAVSGRQLAGPDVAEWSLLDPRARHEVAWNRGGSYITFAWTGDRKLTLENPSPDVILVTGSPCAVAERLDYVTTIVASRELDFDCLEPRDTFAWGGSLRWVYAVSP